MEQVSSRMVPLTVKMLYPIADEIVAVSHGVAQDLSNFMLVQRKPIHVIYNSGVTPEIFELAKQEIDHPWFQEKNQAILVGAGRFVKQKDFPSLLKAFSKLRKNHSARLVLLGDGREQKVLEALVCSLGIEDDVWMPGFVSNPYAFLSRSDVFILSSAWEGLPTVLVEALALKIPVVSTNCPSGPAEILLDGDYGQLVSIGDVEAMASAAASVLAGNRRTPAESWLQQFTPEVAIHKYLAVAGILSSQ